MTDTQKRIIAAFLPYRKTGDTFEFFLQKRSANAPRFPGKIGMFGGGTEAHETIEEALMREVREELSYTPQNAVVLAFCDGPFDTVTIYTEEVGADFESRIVIGEGDYGRFYSVHDALELGDATKMAQLAIEQFAISRGNTV